MAFTVRDFHDLVELLQQQPDWRAELRRLVLSEELLTLPQLVRDLSESQQRSEQRLSRLEQIVADLVEAQRRAEQRLSRLEQIVADLAEAQRRAEQRLDRLEQVVADLAEAQRRTEQRVAELHEAQLKTEQRVAELVEAQTQTERRLGRIEIDHGRFKGLLLEEHHRQRPFTYLQSLIRKARVIEGGTLDELLDDAMNRGALSQEQADDVTLADVVVRGRLKTDGSEVYLVVEVSWGVGPGDVERAARRAKLLALAGLAAMPVVSGNGITPEAVDRCREMQVWHLIHGHAIDPVL